MTPKQKAKKIEEAAQDYIKRLKYEGNPMTLEKKHAMACLVAIEHEINPKFFSKMIVKSENS